MKINYVIKKALLSEKAYVQMEKGVYTFMVDKNATKNEIKRAVEEQFKTKVRKVNVLGKAAKSKKITGTRKNVLTGSGKKAVVYLAAGENIAMLSPKKESKTKKASKEVKEEKKTDKKSGLLSKLTGSKKSKEEQEK
jgi:large subunit ribosomal protein L23